LELGTASKNSSDMSSRGRSMGGCAFNQIILDLVLVQNVKDCFISGEYSVADIACKFDIDVDAVRRIIRAGTHKVTGDEQQRILNSILDNYKSWLILSDTLENPLIQASKSIGLSDEQRLQITLNIKIDYAKGYYSHAALVHKYKISLNDVLRILRSD